MANKRPKPEEIVSKLRQVEVLMGQGLSRLDAIRRIGVVEQTYYRWRKQYGGMGVDQLKELKRVIRRCVAACRRAMVTSGWNSLPRPVQRLRQVTYYSVRRSRLTQREKIRPTFCSMRHRQAATFGLSRFWMRPGYLACQRYCTPRGCAMSHFFRRGRMTTHPSWSSFQRIRD